MKQPLEEQGNKSINKNIHSLKKKQKTIRGYQ
jgi:hypothetical protein